MSHSKALYDGGPAKENSLPNNCNNLTKQHNGYFSIASVIITTSAHRGFSTIYNLYSEKFRCNHRF